MPNSPAKVSEKQAGGQAMAVMKIFVKIVAKKDSTEAMVKSLLSRTHVTKPLTFTVDQTDGNNQFLLQYRLLKRLLT